MTQLQGLETYLDRSVYIAKDKLTAEIIMKQPLRILTEIKDNLKVWELDIFRASCFGHFLDLDWEWTEGGKQGKCNTFVGQYVHFFMLRRMRIPKKKEMWFLLEGKPARFSIKEFAMEVGYGATIDQKFWRRSRLSGRIAFMTNTSGETVK